jgi:hypothetical protein
MTTDTVVLERALVVMAISMALQTLLFTGVAVAAFIAWRRTSAAFADAKARAEAQIAELRVQLERMAITIDETARAIRSGSTAVDDVMTDVRDAMGTVRNSVGTVASAVAAPRTALAYGVLQGIQYWRKRRAAQRLAEAATSEL